MICKKCKRENFDIHSSDNHVILKCKVCKTIHAKFDHPNYCCTHKNLKIVKCQMADGRFFKSNMCINCLKNFGNVKKTENEYMYVGYEERQELREKIQTEYYSLFKSVMENKKYFKLDYYEYLQTEEWKIKRNQRLKIDNYTCQNCGIHTNLQVHHLDYSTIFNESMNDLITMCKPCHFKLHEND